jgi:hypothetical protein
MNFGHEIETFFTRTLPSVVGDVWHDVTGLARDVIRTPGNIAGSIGSTVTSVVGTAGNTISNIGNNAADATKNIFGSPILIIGGIAALVLFGPMIMKRFSL